MAFWRRTASKDVDEGRMTFGEHLEELRWRLIICIIALFVCFVFCWIFRLQVMEVLAGPHRKTMRALGFTEDLKLTAYQEAFITLMKVCFISALFLASPVVIYQIWKFVSSGLYPHERKYVYIFAPFSIGCFLVGVLFGYFILIPFGLRFLMLIVGDVATPIIKMSEYISLLMLLTLLLGVVFELPLVMLFLTKIDVVTVDALRGGRKYAILGAFVMAAILTPPDPGTQIMLALPMIALYEVGILIAAPSKQEVLRIFLVVLALVGFLIGMRWFMGRRSRVVGRTTTPIHSVAPDGRSIRMTEGNPVPSKYTLCTKQEPAAVALARGGLLKLNSQSELKMLSPSSFELKKGEVWISTDHNLAVDTADGTIQLRNGEIDVRLSLEGTRLVVVRGRAIVTSEERTKTIQAGQGYVFKAGGRSVNVGEVIEWTRQIPHRGKP